MNINKIKIAPKVSSKGLTIDWEHGYLWFGDLEESWCFATLSPYEKEDLKIIKKLHIQFGKILLKTKLSVEGRK